MLAEAGAQWPSPGPGFLPSLAVGADTSVLLTEHITVGARVSMGRAEPLALFATLRVRLGHVGD